jgi:spore coat protein U-like protein
MSCESRVLHHLLITAVSSLIAASASAGSCTVSTTGLAFGAYQPLTFAGKLVSADVTSDATVSVVCTGITTGGSYTIALGPSPQGNSIIPRYLAHNAGGPAMAFNVYLDSSYMTVWGDGFTGSAITGTLPIGDSSQRYSVFGRIPAGQSSLMAGTYSGSLTMTITYNP